MKFLLKTLIRFAAITMAFLAIAYYIPGVHVSSLSVAVVVAVAWGLVMLFVRPVLALLTLPINLLTLGLFTFVLNALLFLLIAALIPGFSVAGFIPALEGSVVLVVVGWVLHVVLKAF